ncbi:MAG: prepilin-type N-terminal cleavage/methylation domain-containing protein [Planctomycetes bacterium]|nr:prepilin-type N-terminal cleavage/methylation domain-containing protein [Planctomycetota bacterium]
MRRAGFSLIEVLVAFAILAIGASSALAVFAAATAAHRRAADRVRETLLAEAVVSAIRGELVGDIPLAEIGERVKRQDPGAVAPGYVYRFELAPLSSAGPIPEILIRVWVKRAKGEGEEALFETVALPRADWRRKGVLGSLPRIHAPRAAIRRD